MKIKIVFLIALLVCPISVQAATIEWTLDANAIASKTGKLTGFFDVNSNNQVTNFSFSGTNDFGDFILNSKNSPISLQYGSSFSAVHVDQPQTYFDPSGNKPVITTYNLDLVVWLPINFSLISSTKIPVAQDSLLAIFEVGQGKSVHTGGANFEGTLTSAQISPVPLPASFPMFALGLFALVGAGFYRKAYVSQ